MTVEDIVAKHERGGIAADEIRADMIGLRQSLGLGLDGVGQRHAPFAAIAQQRLESGGVMRRGDDQHIANARKHEGRQRIIDHRFIINRHQLLRDALGQRIESCAGPAGQYYSLAHMKLPEKRWGCRARPKRLQGGAAVRKWRRLELRQGKTERTHGKLPSCHAAVVTAGCKGAIKRLRDLFCAVAATGLAVLFHRPMLR